MRRPAVVGLGASGNQTYKPGNVETIKNLSGYSKIGFDWRDSSDPTDKRFIEGYYSINKMKQTGNVAPLTNGDFDQADKSGQPKGWNQEEDIFGTERGRVIELGFGLL